LSRKTHWRRLWRKRTVGDIDRRARRRIPETGLGRDRSRCKRSADHGQKSGDTKHGTLRAIEFGA
jgi:hypothetical protein